MECTTFVLEESNNNNKVIGLNYQSHMNISSKRLEEEQLVKARHESMAESLKEIGEKDIMEKLPLIKGVSLPVSDRTRNIWNDESTLNLTPEEGTSKTQVRKLIKAIRTITWTLFQNISILKHMSTSY